MKLLCENHRTVWTKELLQELEKTNRFYRTGALLCPQRTHREGLFSPGNVLIPSGASGDCGQQIPAASEWGAAGSRGNGGYGFIPMKMGAVHSEPVDCQRSQVSVRAAGSPHFPPAGSRIRWSSWWRTTESGFPRRPAARF